MTPRVSKNILSFILLIATVSIITASAGYKPKIVEPITEFWRWQNFPELSGRGCQCMAEDDKGLLWFGINGGVLCYDGLNWKDYKLIKDAQDVPVVALFAASNGTIYAGSTRGIFVFQDRKWFRLSINLDFGDPNDFPYNRFPIIETSDKSIWIGSKHGAVRIYDGTISLYREDSFYQNIQDNTQLSKIKSSSPYDIYSLCSEKPGILLLGLRDGRIYRCNYSNSVRPLWTRLDTDPTYTLTKYPIVKATSSGKIFIVSGQNDGGIKIREGNSWKSVRVKQMFRTEDIQNDILELKDGSICISGIGRVFIYKNNEWKIYERPKLPFPSNRLRLFQTSKEKLWVIGLSNDVWRIDLSDKKWATYTDISFQAEERDGNKWFITVNNTVVKTDGEMRVWTEYNSGDGLIDTPVGMIVSRNGEIWAFGSHQYVAATAYFSNGKWFKQLHPELSWGIDRRAVLDAPDGSIWFGTTSDFDANKKRLGGLVRYIRSNSFGENSFQFEYYPSSEDFRLFGIYGMAQSGDGNIWVGQLGFYCYNLRNKFWKKITTPVGLVQNFVDCIESSKNGNIWVGTRTNGLFYYDYRARKWTQYTTKNGLASNSILSILAQTNGNIWIATDKDISHFDGKTWANDIFPGFILYRRDGISLKSTRDGSLWINENPAVWYRKALYAKAYFANYNDNFRTIRYHPDKLPPETVITFSMDKVAQPGNAILSWKANDLWKNSPSDQIQYSYRFDDGEWSAYSKKTSEIFLSLSSGNHTFEVKSRNRDLNVDPTPAKVSFYVISPTWEQPWFIFLILTFLSIITSFIIYLYHRNKIIQELSETRVRLFTNISHELRTPLTLIMGPLSKILNSIDIKQELKQPLSLMERNCQRLLRLINQILDYRKIEVGQLKFEPNKGDVIDFIREEFLSFATLAESKKIDFRFKTTIDKLEIWFDPDKMEKVLFNLLSNALKFTPQNKSITVELRHNTFEKEKTIYLDQTNSYRVINWLEILVSDSGIGIAPQNLSRIFDSFFQVQDHLNNFSGGTGIGLSVAKEMVKIHFGEIKVDSTIGVGTTFTVRIPIMNQEMIDGIIRYGMIDKSDYIKSIQSSEDIVEAKISPEGERNKILIIEDNYDMRQYIRGELINEYDIEEAIDGEDGFEKALSYGPDLIISDIMMPQMDGIELCNKLKTDERTSHISIILLTARSSQQSMINGLENGADEYLTKPFNRDELQLRIHNMIETRKSIQQKFTSGMKIEPKNIPVTSVDQKFMQKAIEIIEQHMDDPDFSVEKFSELMAMNRVSLYHKIKSLTNLPTREFFTVIRLKRSAQLLRESGLSITEIAYGVGFKDPSHYSKLFKKQFGKSPTAYIKESKE